LPKTVIDIVATGVVQVLALEIDLRATEKSRQALREIEL
jgi:hypothetical protein